MSHIDVTGQPVDWRLHCLCQSSNSQPLQNATKKGFVSLEKDLKDLEQLDALPFHIDLQRLNNGTGIVSTLITQKAVYHKNCRSVCNSSHVKRARDTVEKQDGTDSKARSKKLRSSYQHLSSKEVCVLCEEANGVLHKVSTMNVDANLKDCANKTSNFLLHALLVTGPTDAHAAD